MSDPLTVERTYNAPINVVWQAITDKDQMKQWYFDLPEFKPEVGFEFSFEGGNEDRTYIHHCRIVEIIPGRKLKHTWIYEGHEGESFVTFELFPEGDKTRIQLTHEGLETFPPIADFRRENFQEGWNDIIGRSLKEFVEK
jgi:uncharacterized protein YndB with AHSA1/START domain